MVKKAQIYDKFLRDIQTLVAIGMVPVYKLSEGLRNQISKNAKAKTKISDAIPLFGYAQFNFSLRVRYMNRPHLKMKYSNLCSLNIPVTSFLFGDDVQKEIKKCDTSMSIAKDQSHVILIMAMRLISGAVEICEVTVEAVLSEVTMVTVIIMVIPVVAISHIIDSLLR